MNAAGPKWRRHCERASMLATQPDTINQPLGQPTDSSRHSSAHVVALPQKPAVTQNMSELWESAGVRHFKTHRLAEDNIILAQCSSPAPFFTQQGQTVILVVPCRVAILHLL